MHREDHLVLLEALGHEFGRRGMSKHVENLRRYYLAVHRGLECKEVRWSEGHTEEWLAVFRIPPYRERYAVRLADYRCGCRPLTATDTHTALTFPGGMKRRCAQCGAMWLVLD